MPHTLIQPMASRGCFSIQARLSFLRPRCLVWIRRVFRVLCVSLPRACRLTRSPQRSGCGCCYVLAVLQEHLREVRDLTEALTKDESVLLNHDLANEPERSVSFFFCVSGPLAPSVPHAYCR